MKITAITNCRHKLHTQSASFKGKENRGINDNAPALGVLSITAATATICSCLAGCENTLNDDQLVKKTATLLYPVADNLGQMQHKKVLNDLKSVYSQILPNIKQEKISDTEMQYSYKDKEGNLHAIRILAVKMPDSKNKLVLGKIYNNEKLTGKFKLYADNKKNTLEGMLNENPFKFYVEE